MTTATTPAKGTDKVRVLIFPAEGQFVVTSLDLCVLTTEPTKEEAARSITELIDDHVLTGKIHGIPFERLKHNARQSISEAYVRAYNSAESFDYKPTLSPEVSEIVREIEYRFSPDAL